MRARPATDHDGARPSPGSSSPEQPEDVARAVVLRRLAMGPRTRAQLREAVLSKDVPEPVADAVLDRFTAVGLVDDAEFAREWVRIRHRDKGLSRRALADELRRKGVDPELVEAALDGADGVDGDDERAAAEALVARRLPSTRGVDHPKRVNRLVGMLARKGYGPGLAGDVVRRALAAERDGDDGTDDVEPLG
ncbi:regulatory protein RecX [Aquipuribacter hungaricus]|uniref:regulatory protein RecX n=1 Tax=Aquipuribacter hungaricus TaxID=545624 RepID=UPI00366B5BC0